MSNGTILTPRNNPDTPNTNTNPNPTAGDPEGGLQARRDAHAGGRARVHALFARAQHNGGGGAPGAGGV